MPLISRGIQFCDSSNMLLYNDPSTNATFNIVTDVISAMLQVFPDALFHVGGDETKPAGVCTYDVIHAFEKQLQVRGVVALGICALFPFSCRQTCCAS